MADPESGPSAAGCVGPDDAICDEGDERGETLGRIRGLTDDSSAVRTGR